MNWTFKLWKKTKQKNKQKKFHKRQNNQKISQSSYI